MYARRVSLQLMTRFLSLTYLADDLHEVVPQRMLAALTTRSIRQTPRLGKNSFFKTLPKSSQQFLAFQSIEPIDVKDILDPQVKEDEILCEACFVRLIYIHIASQGRKLAPWSRRIRSCTIPLEISLCSTSPWTEIQKPVSGLIFSR